MKSIKKLVISLLALVMVMGASVTALAAGEGSITIKNAVAGQEYNVYRVFDFVAANDSNMEAGGVYTLSAKFNGFSNSFFSVGDNGILSFAEGLTADDAAAFGQAAIAYAKANGIAADGTATASEDGAVTISGLDYGYYVVDSSLGSALAVDTTTPNAEIEEKNDVPKLDKTITGATNAATIYDTTGNGAQIGDVVTYTITADLKKGGYDYVIHDEMTEGLTFNEITSITFSNGNVAYDEPTTSAHGFTITFTEAPAADTTATVVYTATLNKDAVIADASNDNEAYLTYGNNTETVHKTTTTKTYPMQIKKVIGGTETVLAGATFNVYRDLDGSLVAFTKASDTEYKVDPAGTVTDIVTVADTPITITGLNAETYTLVETQAPAGYNLLTETVNGHEHAQSVTITTSSTTTAPTVATIENSTGSILPSTGGIGTTIFYIVGGVLIVAGIAYFIVRRKANAE